MYIENQKQHFALIQLLRVASYDKNTLNHTAIKVCFCGLMNYVD